MIRAIRQRQRKLSQRDEGFSLVELVVAMFIIAGVLMVLIGTQISAAVTVTEARKREQATAVANEAMEQMRSIPWAVLSRGLYSGYLTAAGGDPNVSGGKLKSSPDAATATIKLRIAPSTADQKPTVQAWAPLFDSTGSNKHVVTDPSKTGTQFTVRAYVTEPGNSAVNAVGLAVIVEWTNGKGDPSSLMLLSTAYRGTGCGNEESAPFLGACQAYYDASSSSGSVATSVSASTVSNGTTPTTPLNLLYPTSDPFYDLSMRAAIASSTMSSQQVSNGTAMAQWGGTTLDDNDSSTQPVVEGWTNGYRVDEIRITNDTTQTSIPLHVGSTTYQQGSSAEDERFLSDGGTRISFTAKSDYRRQATLQGSSTTSCKTGIPAGAPCAVASVANLNTLEGAGYIIMRVDGALIRLSRRLSESGTTSNSDLAWSARFTSTAGSASVGCTSLADSGCTSAGAERQLAQLSIGAVVGGTWVNPSTLQSAASDGIVVVEGASACAAGMFETVLVQRGVNQKTQGATYTRCGQIRYWNGSAYTTLALSATSTAAVDSTPVTYTVGAYTITAQAHINVTSGGQTVTAPDANCKSDACAITATTGSIVVDVRYVITRGADTYTVISTTNVGGPIASASFKAAPSA